MLTDTITSFISGQRDKEFIELLGSGNTPKIRGMFSKKDSKDNAKFSLSAKSKHGFCFCCSSSSSGNILFQLKNVDIVNKQLIFDVSFYSSYFQELLGGYDYTFDTTVIIDYNFKLFTVTSSEIKYDYADCFGKSYKDDDSELYLIEGVNVDSITKKCKSVLERMAKLLEFTYSI